MILAAIFFVSTSQPSSSTQQHFESLGNLAAWMLPERLGPPHILVNMIDIHEVMSKIFDASSVLISNSFAWVVLVCVLVKLKHLGTLEKQVSVFLLIFSSLSFQQVTFL